MLNNFLWHEEGCTHTIKTVNRKRYKAMEDIADFMRKRYWRERGVGDVRKNCFQFLDKNLKKKFSCNSYCWKKQLTLNCSRIANEAFEGATWWSGTGDGEYAVCITGSREYWTVELGRLTLRLFPSVARIRESGLEISSDKFQQCNKNHTKVLVNA